MLQRLKLAIVIVLSAALSLSCLTFMLFALARSYQTSTEAKPDTQIVSKPIPTTKEEVFAAWGETDTASMQDYACRKLDAEQDLATSLTLITMMVQSKTDPKVDQSVAIAVARSLAAKCATGKSDTTPNATPSS